MKTIVDLSSIAAVAAKQAVPAGYVEITLSTEGKVFAPKSFHMRNFNTRDLIGLALTEEVDLTSRIVDMLGDMCYEKDIDFKFFHEKEIVETLLKIYIAFFSAVLTDVPFSYDETDLQWLKDHNPEAQYLEKKALLESGKWNPLTDINLVTGTDVFELSAKFNPVATIQGKTTGFSCAFGLERFGDVLILKKWLDERFGEKERSLAGLKRRLELREKMVADYESGASVDIDRIPDISASDEKLYNDFVIEKATALVDVIRGMHLVSWEHEDVRVLPLVERIALVQDPRLDANIAKKLDAYFEKLEFGIKPEVRMLNPITNEECLRRFSFRFDAVLQAIQLHTDDEYDIVFTDEY